MRPIFKWTLFQRRLSTIWWSIGMFAFIFITMVFYPTFKSSAAQLQKSFETLPKAAVQLFGGSTDFFSPVGYMNSQIFFLMLPLLLTVLAVGLGSSLLAREEQSLTIELLLARPVKRSRLLAAKALAGSVILLIVTLVSTLTIAASVAIFKVGVPQGAIFLACFSCFLLAFATGAIAFLLSATGRARGAAIGLSSFIGFGGYLVVSLAGTVKWLKTPAKFFPFNYYQSEAILRQNFHLANFLFPIIVAAACGGLAVIAFRRRDIG